MQDDGRIYQEEEQSKQDDGRICLKERQRVELSQHPDGRNKETYRILSVAGRGGSAVCYEAVRELDGQTGMLKEFYPMDLADKSQPWNSLKRLANGQLVPCGGTVRKFQEMCDDYVQSYQMLIQVIRDNRRNEILKNFIQIGDIRYGCVESTIVDAELSLQSDYVGGDTENNQYERATVYIWSPGINGQRYDEHLKEMRKRPEQNSDYKLYEILQTLCALTDCMIAFHTVGLMHLDIKPANFAVPYRSDYSLNAGSISMFDVNTFYPVGSESLRFVGTDGFRAPELLKGKADNRSDIYSIGAMLFLAIVVSKDIPDGLYRDEYYEEINQLVRHSKLITGAEANSDVRLMSKLATILKKCLASKPNNRYDSCSSLLADLKDAKNRLTQYITPVGQNRKMRIVSVNEKGTADPVLVIQKLLHDHPLYEVIDPEKPDIHVLVVGSGTYGQKFIDQCLQAGQMKNYTLHIRAISDMPAQDREDYLKFRPAISRFVNVNHSMTENVDKAYGTLSFEPLLMENADNAESERTRFRMVKKECIEAAEHENKEIIESIILEADERKEKFDYIFIALGDNQTNYSVAKCFSETLKDYKGEQYVCPVCFVRTNAKKSTRKEQSDRLYPVYINKEITPETISSELDQMAFRTDISWSNTLNMDVGKVYKEFLEDHYRYSSSRAYALSIRYKLFSVGIILKDDFQSMRNHSLMTDGAGKVANVQDCQKSCSRQFVVVKDIDEAAKVFYEKFLVCRDSDAEAEKTFDVLVALEHRRWVLEKVTDGWDVPRDKNGKLDLKSCVTNGVVQNKEKLTHPCIVFSDEPHPLSGEAYEVNAHEKWDDPDIDAGVDELDRVSLKLHQYFRAKAEEIKAKNPLHSEDLEVIKSLLPYRDETAARAYKQFLFCLKNILNGVESYTRQFGYYKKALSDSLGNVSDDVKKKMETRLKLVKKTFFPVIEANLYRDYKANDDVLIERIPFILTCRLRPTIAMAFEDGRYQNGTNEAVFANVAAATVLSPKQIYYFYCFHTDSKADLLENKLSGVLNYLRQKNICSKVTLLVACLKDVSDKNRKELQDVLERFVKTDKETKDAAVMERYEIFDCPDLSSAADEFMDILHSASVDLYDGSTQLFHSVMEDGKFANEVVNSNIPYFEFDWRKKRFTRHDGCDYLQYIKDGSCIRIQDMFALMNAVDNKFNLPEFAEDYETLWKIYTGSYLTTKQFENGVGNWNRLCNTLAAYEENRKPLAEFPMIAGDSVIKRELVFVLPEFVYKAAQSVISGLKEYKIVDAESEISSYTSENCRLRIFAPAEYAEKLEKLFSNPTNLLYHVQVNGGTVYNDNKVTVTSDDLLVTDVDLDPEGKGSRKYSCQILKELQEGHFISQLPKDAEKQKVVSFVYSSSRIKKLMTTAGEILEIYAYYQVLKSGYFDDVASGYEFCWEKDGVKNELDLVLTKGFRSMIVECKAVQKLELGYYHKLHSIADHFGIGAVKVLIGNTYRHRDAVINEVNKMQRSRGSQLNIKTISAQNKIENIGETLKELMEE